MEDITMRVRRLELLEVDKDLSHVRVVFDGFYHDLWCSVCQDGRVLDERGKLLFRISKPLAKACLEMIDAERRRYSHAVGI